MGRFRVRLALLSSAVLLMAGSVQASITRVIGPTDIVYEPRVFVKFDAAFDSVNRVNLVVWGTQGAGPTNGLFLNEAGTPIGPAFAISNHSDGSLQAGWARVIYSPQEGKFLVSYTKILAVNVHAKAARFVTYSGGTPVLSNEITIASGFGHPGTESGIAYSVPARKFFVTWWTYSASYGPSVKPITFVTAIDPSGTIQSPPVLGMTGWGIPITNPNDGQSDPEIGCDPVNRHCFVVGWSWGTFYGGNAPPPAVWGRYIDDVTGAPLGADSFYLPTLGYIDSPTVSFGAGRFLVAYTGNGQVLGNIASGAGVDATTVGPYYALRVSNPTTAAQDGGGYFSPSLSFNSKTNTTLLAVGAYQGYPVAQEIDASGVPIEGALDFIPDPGANYNVRTQYTIPVANSVVPGFLYLDNHYFVSMRASFYSTSGVVSVPPPPPPPPPPTCTASLSTLTMSVPSSGGSYHLDVAMPPSCAWTATTTAPWIQITWNASASGPGSVGIEIGRNLGVPAGRNGTIVVADKTVSVYQVGFNASSTHDMTGDGFSDVVWQHQPSGALAMWSIRGSAVTSTKSLPSVADPTWKVVGTGDLDGDGYADLVWEKDDGTLAAWLLRPGQLPAGRLLSIPSVDPNYRVRAVADLSGDGYADIVLQHQTEGGSPFGRWSGLM